MVRTVLARMIVSLYVVVVLLSIAVSWIGAKIAGEEVEQRLVHDMAQNTAGLFANLNLRPSDGVMLRLSRLVDGHVLVLNGKSLISSSLGADAENVRGQLIANDMAAFVLCGKVEYAVGRATVSYGQPDTEELDLYLLIPNERIKDARQRTTWRLVYWTVLAILIATALTTILSFSITRPIRRLARAADRLSAQELKEMPPSLGLEKPISGPTEIALLAESFDRLLESLAHSQNRLAEFERLAALGKVTASVAHEIRNPLSGIKMHLRLLQDATGLAADDEESIRLISREIERMDLFLEELMAIARKSPEEARLNKGSWKEVSLAEQARSVLHLLAGKIRHANIDVNEDLNDQAELAFANPVRMRQVIMNLLLNALEATPADGPILLTVGSRDGWVRFAVRDRGPGVEDDEINVFDAFATSKPNGGGLGLYICKRVVDEHDGRIGFENHDDGAEFWFEIQTSKT